MGLLESIRLRCVLLTPLQCKLVLALTVLACCIFGFVGLVTPCLALYFVATIGLDADTVAWFKRVHSTYLSEQSDESAPDLCDGPNIVPSRRTAVKFAIRAQSKVGMLKPSEANRLVYETVLLRLFDEYHVRHNVRISLLGEALVACFVRPKEYERALDVIDYMGSKEPIPGLE